MNCRVSFLAMLTVIYTSAPTISSAQSNPSLVLTSSEENALNVTIPVFDPGIPDDPSVFREQQVFPRIRNIEAKIMPFLLRETLVATEQWGAVRVVEDPEAAAELLVFGQIVRSDGDYLDLRIRAIYMKNTFALL